jgi:hypothetical protein
MADLDPALVEHISSTLPSESGNRMYIIIAKRMTSGLVLKHLKGGRLVIPAG